MTKRVTESDIGLARLLAERRQLAARVTKEQLEAWYEPHVAALSRDVTEAWRVQAHNLARLKLGDPRWQRYWLAEARARYLHDSLMQAVKRGHVMSCLNHGVHGVPDSVPFAEAVAWQGSIDGDVWLRYCLDCQEPVIAVDGKRLAEAWER